jgi:hypothetical protein
MKSNFTKVFDKSNPAPSVPTQFGMLVLLLLLIAMFSTKAQTISPLRYWTFNGANAGTDSMGVSNLNFTTYNSQYTVGTNGQVGKFISLDAQSNLIDGGPLPLSNAVSVEFLFKPGYMFNTTNMIKRGDGAFAIRMEYPKISFYTTVKTSSGSMIEDEFIINLDGIGRKTFGYYVDGNWHHMAFVYNATTGVKQVYVDGQLPTGFSKTVANTGTINSTGNTNFYLNHTVNYVKYFGSIDELAVYNTAIPANFVYKHYLGTQNGQPYSFINNYNNPLPTAAPITGPVDPMDFAPGHPSVTISAIEQLNSYPVPRYKPGNTLLKNFNWMDPKYMGGLFQPGVTTQNAVDNSVLIQTELAKNYNYYFNVELGNDLFDIAWANAANANPDFKLALTIFRAQLNGNSPELTSQNKPANHYLQNSSGQFIDINGNVTTSKIWRPTAPTASYNNDGQNIYNELNNLYTRLTRNIDIVNENGEVFPHPEEVALNKDPDVVAAKNASGMDWPTFLASKFKENEVNSYRNIFMAHPRMANAKFTEYSTDGFPLYRFKYSQARLVNSQINGQYYSTPDFYPRWANNWRNWVSAWHGWQWIVESRVNELAVGDRLYSPFVAAGWDANEEVNIRPGQWLGLLKALGMTGAEFFYSGFFSLSSPWPDSRNWIWQAAMPPYAQAISSRYEDFLRNGELMNGDVANSYVTPTAPGYSFWCGDLSKLVVIRKHNAGNKYAITGSVQPNSNMVGNSPDEGVAKITLDGQVISFKVRKQGSTYIYDKTNAAAPVFYQLDGWHEKSHPSHWTKDFNFEAELFDNTNSQVSIKTSVPAGAAAGDFTNFTSYVSWPDNATSPAPVEYNFRPRSASNATLYLWVRARSRGGVTSSMNVQMDNMAARTIGCINDTAWTWYRYDACTQQAINYNNINVADHKIIITPGNAKLEIDQVLLTTSSSLILNSAPPSCGSATATVTANGSTSFCTGGSVTLTASAGTSYFWSPGGQTTQSITVSNSGSFYVTVGSGSSCSAISNPVTVSVSNAPTATITTSGSTTLCQGANVTLNAPAGAASYLWTPGGQTTQSITTGTAGQYSVRVTNAGGCSATSSPVTVSVGTTPSAVVTAGGPTSFCQGGSVSLSTSGGSSYLWFPGGQTTASINVTAAGNYSVRVTGTGGCTAMSQTIPVTVNSIPTATISAGGPTSFCAGGSVTLSASSGASYLWTPGGQTTQSITVSNSGSYTVRVTNASGCSATSAATSVNANATPSAAITANGPTSFCAGGNVTLTATSGSSYLWTPGGQTTQSITVGSAGSYSVRVTNGSGCSATSAATNVSVQAAPNAQIANNGPLTFCQGGSVNLTASAGASYLWSPGGQTTQTINVTNSGAYTVRVTNSSGCSTISSATNVNVNSLPVASISANGPLAFCTGGSVTLTASSGSSYLWTPGGQTSQSITVSNAGSYSVRVTNASGCSATSAASNVSITSNPVATITASGNTTLCQGGNVDLTASNGSSWLWSTGETTQTISVSNAGSYAVTVSAGAGCSATSAPQVISMSPAVSAVITPNGPTTFTQGQNVVLNASGGTSYVWAPDGETTPSITVTSSGIYSVTAYNANGCSKTSDPIVVSVIPVAGPPATITLSGPAKLCPGQNVVLTANAGASYLWSPGGQTTRQITVTTAGTYYVTVVDNNGVSSTSADVIVSVNPAPAAPAVISSFIPGSGYQLKAYEPTAHNYIWSNGATTQTINVNAIGNYTVKAINGLGCESPIQSMAVTATNSQPCAKANMLSHYAISNNNATVSWNPAITADSFRVAVQQISTANVMTFTVPGNQSKLDLQDLLPGTSYKWYVYTICGSTQLLSSSKVFTTLNTPLPCGSTPQYLKTDVVNATFAKVSWYDTQSDRFVIRYRAVGTSTYIYRRSYNTLTEGMIQGLIPSTTYEWSVRSMCDANVSLYSEPMYFTTLSACPSVGGVTAADIGFNSAQLNWNSSISVDTLMIRIAITGTTDYKVIKLAGNPNPGNYTVTGLIPETTYDAWVATKCGSGSTSAWGTPATFTTLSEPVVRTSADPGILNVNAYPNPTKLFINYAFTSKEESEYTVKVCDISGRELLSEVRVANEGLHGEKVSLGGFASGLYMLVIQQGPMVGRFKFNISE